MKRIYKVDLSVGTNAAGYQETRLVRAGTQAQAAAHVVKGSISVTIPSQDELFKCAAAGCQIEEA